MGAPAGIVPGQAAAAGDEAALDPQIVQRLDRVMLRMRRSVAKPPAASLPIPAMGHCVDFAKVMACLAVAEESDDHRGSTTVKDVAASLELEHSTASRLLSEAESDGLLDRHSDPDDRRRTVVSLTGGGRAVVAESTAMRTRVISDVFAQWDPADLEALVGLLERMVATIAERMPKAVAELASDGPPC